MRVIEQALHNRTVRNGFSIAGVGYVRWADRDAIPVAADFLLTEENVHTSIVYGLLGEEDGREVVTGSLRTLSSTMQVDALSQGRAGRRPAGAAVRRRAQPGGRVRDPAGLPEGRRGRPRGAGDQVGALRPPDPAQALPRGGRGRPGRGLRARTPDLPRGHWMTQRRPLAGVAAAGLAAGVLGGVLRPVYCVISSDMHARVEGARRAAGIRVARQRALQAHGRTGARVTSSSALPASSLIIRRGALAAARSRMPDGSSRSQRRDGAGLLAPTRGGPRGGRPPRRSRRRRGGG